MAHAEGWIEAYDALKEGRDLPWDLLSIILSNRNRLGESMLHWYAIEGEPAAIEKIINLGFDVNATNTFGRTPLFECVLIDRWEVAELLLNHGARTDITDQNDENVFAYLDDCGEQEKAQKLQELTSRLIQRRVTSFFEFGLPFPPWMAYSFCEEMKLQSAPPYWHFAINFPVAIVWMVGFPFVACSLLQIPLWWAILIAPIWALLTGRITDRGLPALTGPVIDRVFIAIGREHKPSSPLMPESDYVVEVTNSGVRSTRPDGTVEEITWGELTGFDIETNSLGPFAPDVFWILHGDSRGCVIPQGATGDGALLERLQQLPDFDSEKFMEAMASTSETTFEIWRKNNNTEQAVTPNA